MENAEMSIARKMHEIERALSSSYIVVGWLDDNGSLQTARANLRYRNITGRRTNAIAKQPSQALIAATMNYGRQPGTTLDGRSYGAIPARPFMTFAEEIWKKTFPKVLRRCIPKVLRGIMTVDELFSALGEAAKDSVQKAIMEGDYAPLSPKTVAAKGSNKPLFDTGSMVGSVTFEIRKV